MLGPAFWAALWQSVRQANWWRELLFVLVAVLLMLAWLAVFLLASD